MFRKIQDFVNIWGEENKATLKVLNSVTEQNKKQAVAEGFRTLERLAWHITTTLPEMCGKIDVEFKSHLDENAVPPTVAEIVSAYEKVSVELIDGLKKWNDSDLEKETNMYGEPWKNGTTLMVLISHQAHHRGQMTVLLRQAGLKAPDVCGPAKEDWANFGAQPPIV